MNDAARRLRDAPTQPALQDGDLLAAVDLGSNSFHMVVARYVLGQLRVVDRLREMVRLAEGLDARGGLDPAVQRRALACLARTGRGWQLAAVVLAACVPLTVASARRRFIRWGRAPAGCASTSMRASKHWRGCTNRCSAGASIRRASRAA